MAGWEPRRKSQIQGNSQNNGWQANMMQQTPMYGVLFAVALGLGVTGDLAGCAWIRLPVFWIPLLTACHYVAVLLAAVGFGIEIGLGAAVLTGIAHITVTTTVCAESSSHQGDVAAFLMIGLLAGFLVRRKRSAESGFNAAKVAPSGKVARVEVSHNPEVSGSGKIPVGFVRAIRAPLSAIESAGYVLEDSAVPDANQREVAAIILRECHRLDLLIQVLEFGETRLPDYRDVDLSSVLDEIVRSGAQLTDAAGISLRKGEGPGLRVVCDSSFLEQAGLNLLANAIKVAEHGDGIILSAHCDGNLAMIEISNRRLGVLGKLGIRMAAMPDGALLLNPVSGETLLKPGGRNK